MVKVTGVEKYGNEDSHSFKAEKKLSVIKAFLI